MLRLLLIVASWLSPAGDTNACVEYWQRQLALSDWTVITKIVPDQVLGGRVLGDIDIDDPSKTVTVRLMRIEDSDLPRRLAVADQKFTIAHELMHLRLYVNRNPQWRDEKVVDTATISVMRSHRRWNELRAVERE
jgi:hypothetical protein